MRPPFPQRPLAGALALAFAAAVTAASPAARAGACGADCHTVCVAGCDFPSPRACANGVVTGATCLVLGGHFHETIGLDPDRFTEDIRFVCADPAAAPCRVDGDGVRDHGFLAYRGWEIDGFEIYDTKSHAISNQPSRRPVVVRRCYIHDAGGRGVNDVDIGGVVELNRIARVFGTGILCTQRDALVQNNLVIDAALDSGSGIQCATTGSLVLHNTVDVRRALAATGAIDADVARYNVVAGGATGLRASTDSGENLAWRWAGAPWGGVAGSNGDVTGDPLFFHLEDHRPEVGSPAIGLATTSLAAEDLDGAPRDGAPDAGAYEWADGDVAGPRRWPISEVIADPGDPAAPALVVVPGQGPAVVFIDRTAGALVHAVRQSDGAWLHEVIAAGVVIPDAQSLDPFRHPIAAAVDPISGQLVVAWTQRTAAEQLEVRVARRDGDVCSAGDCVSPRWSGCTAAPALVGDGYASLALAVDPFDGAPVLAVAHQETGSCAGLKPVPHIVALRRAPDGSWSGPTVESGDCTVRLGLGVAVSVDPTSGATDVVYTRTSGGSAGELIHASDAGGVWESAPVPLDAGFATSEASFTRVAAAHRAADGALGVAYSQSSPFGTHGFGYVERLAGVWGASEVVDVVGPSGIRPMEGLALAFDAVGFARLAYARNATARVAARRAEGWDFEIVDPERDTGHWTTLALGPAGEVWVAYQDVDAGGRVRFLGGSDPGGVSPGTALTACDDGDVCTDSRCDAALGCVHAPLDCDDADACTIDRCDPVAGCVNAPLPCSDGDACTVDACDPASGCVFPPVACDDGDACTSDGCQPDGSCEHLAITCDDANDCTADGCAPASGCEFAPVDGPCDDGDPDTIADACAAGLCAGVPAVVLLPAVIEGVVVVDGSQLLAPLVLPLVSEGVQVADVAQLTPPVVLPLVSESVAIADLPALTPPVVLPMLVAGVGFVDAVEVAGPPPTIALPLVVEAVTVADGVPRILPPVVLTPVVEGVAVADASDVLGPPPPLTLPLVVEGVAIADAAELRPPLVLTVIVEAVGMSDAATLLPPVLLPAISEAVRVHDLATVAAPEPAPKPDPGCAAGGGGHAAILATLGLLLAGLGGRRRRSLGPARRRTPPCTRP